MWLAILFSLIFPGLGQIYYGQHAKGIIMLILAITPLWPIALIWSVIDVIRLSKQGIQPRYDLKKALWPVMVALVVVPVCLFISFSGMLLLGNWISDAYIKPKATLEEGTKILTAIERYYNREKEYPPNLAALIEGVPIQSGWTTDAWGEPYSYTISDNGKSFSLISKGKDRILGTKDDIVLSKAQIGRS